MQIGQCKRYLSSYYIGFSNWKGKLTKYCVGWVHRYLVLGSITDETFGIRECYIARRGPISLIVGNDFNFAVLENSDTGIGSSQINSNSKTSLGGHCVFLALQKESASYIHEGRGNKPNRCGLGWRNF